MADLRRKLLLGMVVPLLLLTFTAFAALTYNTHALEAPAQQGGLMLIIRADGSVDPYTAPIQRVGDVYTLTSDVGSIDVQRNDTILDGNGHTLPGAVSIIDALGNNVTVKNSGGVSLNNVENVTVKNLTIKDCKIGIFLGLSSNVNVSGNTITETYAPIPPFQATAGIYIWGGNSNIIVGNRIADNYDGIYLGYETEHNVIVGNNIINNSYGITFWNSSNNSIYHNNFINNTIQVHDTGVKSSQSSVSLNHWDEGCPSGGNYWNDYNGTDANGDGTGDTPYVINETNIDYYPLTEPFGVISLSPFPTTWAVAATVSVAVVGAGLLIYFRVLNH